VPQNRRFPKRQTRLRAPRTKKSHQSYRSRPIEAPASQKENPVEPQAPPKALRPDLALHARKCIICHHPLRDEIEEEFVYWGHPGTIVKRFNLRHRSLLYRHARAHRLYEVRAYNLRAALDHIIERASITSASSESIVRAIKTYAHVNAQGKWEEPIHKVMAVKDETPDRGVEIVVSPALYEAHKARQLRSAEAQEIPNRVMSQDPQNEPKHAP
jgi:hypothetical protein